MHERDDAPPAGAEESAEAEMDACKHAIPHIAAEVFASLVNHGRIVRKQAHEGLGRPLGEGGEHQAETHRDI